MSKINFFFEEVTFKLNRSLIREWINYIVISNGRKPKIINYIFCNDEYLLGINKEFLSHNTYTDIITFNNSETEGHLEADIFISIDRVNENAIKLNVEFSQELLRVVAHGILHLLGYKDKSPEEIKMMRKKEDFYISQFNVPRGTLNNNNK